MKRNAKHTLAACALLVLAAGAQAQVFRIVGPDGRVTYSDKPPVEPSRARAVGTTGGDTTGGHGGTLPNGFGPEPRRQR